MTSDRQEALLALLAVERGYVAADRMRAALAEQAADPVRRLLGTVLVARGDLSDRELLDLLTDLDQSDAERTRARRSDRRLGALLSRRGLVPEELVEECLHAQAEIRRTGSAPFPRIGELLVARRYATTEDVRDALATQNKSILACLGCRRRFNVVEYDSVHVYRCPECGHPLRPTYAGDDIRVDRTATRLAAV